METTGHNSIKWPFHSPISRIFSLFVTPNVREARQSHVQLIKDQKLYEQKIGELEQKCKDMMMMKFGRMIDLEKLEGVTVNR